MFRDGSFSGFRFAGSKTLCAFERASWLATIASGSGQPDTERTHRVEQDTFYHVQVCRVGKGEKRCDVLISDLPGELFPDVLSTQEVCEDQVALARADHLVLFVDCRSMIDSARRHSERDMACRFLSQVKKCRYELTSLQVTVVFSRWDYVNVNKGRQVHEEYCNIVEQDIRARFGSEFGGLRFDRIAARPARSTPTNTEIQAIFAHWLTTDTSFEMATISRLPKPVRDFCAFGLK
jgi:Double-GTPase 2